MFAADLFRGNHLILTLCVTLVVLGASLLTTAWRWADRPDAATKARREMVSSLGSSLLTGAVLAAATLYLQEGLSEANEETAWRSTIINSERLVGFSAEGHDMQSRPRVSFAGKQLIAPDFVNSDLTGVTFRDAVISGADFTGANLTEADFVGATITSAKFNEAVPITPRQTLKATLQSSPTAAASTSELWSGPRATALTTPGSQSPA